METRNARSLLEILLENSVRILRAGFGLGQVESTFFDIVELLRTHPDLKGEFLAKIDTSMSKIDPGRLDAGMLPRELIELVAHELRWSEIRACAEARVHRRFGGDCTRAIGDIAGSVLEAFDDHWGDREFYRHYQRPER